MGQVRRDAVAREQARQLQFARHVHHQHAVGPGVLGVVFGQQRDREQRVAVRRERARACVQLGADARVQDRVEARARLRRSEDAFAQCGAVERAIGREHRVAEHRDDLLERG